MSHVLCYAASPASHTHAAQAADENPFAALLSKPLMAAPAPAPEASLFAALLGKPLVAEQVEAPQVVAPKAPPAPRAKSAPRKAAPDRSIRICGCGDPTCPAGGTDRGWMYIRARGR